MKKKKKNLIVNVVINILKQINSVIIDQLNIRIILNNKQNE